MNLLGKLRDDIWLMADGKQVPKMNFYKEAILAMLRSGRRFNLRSVFEMCKKLEGTYNEILDYISYAIGYNDMIRISREVSEMYHDRIEPLLGELFRW